MHKEGHSADRRSIGGEMKQTQYKVLFKSGGLVIIWAWNFAEAKILAQANQIEEGKNYQVERIDEVKP